MINEKCVLVTAGASGIGLAIASAFRRSGARVHVCDVNDDLLASLHARSTGIEGIRCDVSDSAQVDRMFDSIRSSLGRLDVLVNNAGIAGPTASIGEIAPEQWERTIAVNLSGAFYCARRGAPLLRESGGGLIVNVSSTSARTGLDQRLPYVVSKAALFSLTEGLARELGPNGIRVNTVLPGMVNNARNQNMLRTRAENLRVDTNALREDMLQFVAMRSQVEEDEIASLVLFLASSEARHISGQHIGVCGYAFFE